MPVGKQGESKGTGTTAGDRKAEGLGKDRAIDGEPVGGTPAWKHERGPEN